MAASSERRPRRGPAPIASFDHDVSEESSPETKQALRLPEIREDLAASSEQLAPPEQRARSHSSPAVHAAPPAPPPAAPAAGLSTPAAPRIDISRASSSSHHDSRDSSPELALFAGGDDAKARLDLGFREDGALDLRSSTEELAFLEGAPGGADPPRAPSVAPPSRRHSRKDSQGSEAALLGVTGRQSRLSSVGSQCSAQSALSGFSHASRMSVGRLSVVSGVSRSPSPHKMLLETSFCGPKPIETDPDACAAAVERRLLEIAKMSTETATIATTAPTTTPTTSPAAAAAVDARDRREVRTEVTVESARPAGAPRTSPAPPPSAPAAANVVSPAIAPLDEDKLLKEARNRARAEERRARPKVRRQPSEPEVYKAGNRSKDVIRIKLKPDDEYDDDEDAGERTPAAEPAEAACKPSTLELRDAPRRDVQRLEALGPHPTPPRPSRTPSPPGAAVSRKSSFCSLFKSRETIASPDSPSDVLRRKKSLNEGRSRSKSRDRSATPTSAAKIRGSVLSLFKTPRRSTASPSPSSRDASPVVQQHRQFPQTPPDRARAERLKYYEDTRDGVIHIPLRTPPDEPGPAPRPARPASAPQPRGPPERPADVGPAEPVRRTVLPDGSIIIPLHSPTERTPAEVGRPESPRTSAPPSAPGGDVDASPVVPTSRRSPGDDERASTAASIPSPDGRPPEPEPPERAKRRERLVFTTHVGSRDEQVFSTQFSITKTPSVTSEMSESAPSFPEAEERPSEPSPPEGEGGAESEGERAERGASPAESSGSEAGSGGSAAERRGLVVQESFEELPYVPTTLPLERSLALPMVPVRDRPAAAPPSAAVRRPRARPAPPAPLSAPAAPPTAPPPPAPLRIRLPQRTRASSTGGAVTPRSSRPRSRSGGDGVEVRKEWIDFSELPEQRKQPKRIETVGGAGAAGAVPGAAGAGAVVFSYVPPERCRCECHTHDDERPLLHEDKRNSSSSPECSESGHDAPFTADLDLRHSHADIAPPQ
ncbi:serine/arginine repetitive matrix protein 1 [Aricia agestis]|uniref:serine/arginine repetitive matrix protein 1 n=1 Tax=Aricia agestis TaxID=91739 RepID=UPI001C2083C3|nr:serine/arginine repetitive matrix protein 1 [Aricia agestis]